MKLRISEQVARHLIEEGKAGYWELSLRDSISKTPIAHPLQHCIFVDNTWFLVTSDVFTVESLGRIGNEAMNAAVHSVQCEDSELVALIEADQKRLGKPLS